MLALKVSFILQEYHQKVQLASATIIAAGTENYNRKNIGVSVCK